jgi:Tfp pilus assembly protein PilO
VDKAKSFLLALTWVHVAAVIALLSAYYYFTLDQSEIENRKSSIVELQSQIVQHKAKIEEAKKFELEFEQRKKGYATTVAKLQEMQGALPKQFFLPDLLNDIVGETKRVDLDVTSVSPDPKEEKKELYSTLGVNLEARGSFLQFLVFLDRLATMKRLVGVASIVLDRDGESTIMVDGSRVPFPALRAKIRIVAYRYGSGPG